MLQCGAEKVGSRWCFYQKILARAQKSAEGAVCACWCTWQCVAVTTAPKELYVSLRCMCERERQRVGGACTCCVCVRVYVHVRVCVCLGCAFDFCLGVCLWMRQHMRV